MSASGVALPGADRVIRGLGPAAWLVLLLGAVATFLLPGPPDGTPIRTALVVTLAVFFAILVGRVLLAASHYRTRRLSLLLLAAGVGLWAAGSAMVSASQVVAAVSFPAPGEVLFLGSYLGMAAFLLLDVPRRAMPTAAVWLEAAIVCGAAACLAAFGVLTPLSGTFARGGLALLLAILYPLIDLVLVTIVLAQVMLRQRDRSRRTAAFVLGFLGLAVADSSFVLSLATDAYSSSLLLDALWGVSFAAIVAGGCANPRPRPSAGWAGGRRTAGVLALAAALAVVVLILHPGGVIGWCVMAPAIVTLVGTGLRMMLALQEAQQAAESLRLSLTDELTGLPNRRALMGAIDGALTAGSRLGLALLNLDRFKDVNDSLGHAVGDEVLTALAHRMRAALDQEVTVARLGGDEFALLAPGVDGVELFELAERVRCVLQAPLRVENMDLSIDASVGVAVREFADTSSIELLRRADIAMYEAKSSRAGVMMFDAAQDGFSRHRLRRGEELRQAIAADQLVVWYQPQVDTRTRRVVAMEALVRWKHPTQGMLSPMTFLPDARRSGLMPALTETVMRRVVADTRGWLDAGFAFRVALNCAPPELVGGAFLPKLFQALDRAGIPGEALLVEITEDSFLADPELTRQALYDLRAHRVQTSIDDYGTGFSSLAYLRDLPVQELKMDRSFVSTLLTDERNQMGAAPLEGRQAAVGIVVLA